MDPKLLVSVILYGPLLGALTAACSASGSAMWRP